MYRTKISGIISIKTDGKVYIQCDADANIVTFQSIRSALRSWESMYEMARTVNASGFMSSCVHSILFDIRGHAVCRLEGLDNTVIKKPFDVVCWSSSAGIYGIECLGKEAGRWHTAGVEAKPWKSVRQRRKVK